MAGGEGFFVPRVKAAGARFSAGVESHYTACCIKIGLGPHLNLINYALKQIGDQLRAVVPISLYLILFRVLVFHKGIDDAGLVFMGLVLLIFGLTLFMEGLKLALVPLGELLGSQLPKKVPLWAVLLVAFCLGISVTLAEPAIGVLGTLSKMIEPTRAPYLFLLLGQWNILLMFFVGLGVGFAAILGILRFTRGWSLKPIIFITVTLTIALTCYINWIDDRLKTVVGLAWDCGAVTTGPVTVPIILSIGIGVIAHKRSLNPEIELSPLSGFGIVTLASLYPIVAVEFLALLAFWIYPGDKIMEKIIIEAEETTKPIYEQSPLTELIMAVRAITPLVIVLLFILKVIARENLPRVLLFADDKPSAQPLEAEEDQDGDEDGEAVQQNTMGQQSDMYVGTAVEISLRNPDKGIEEYATHADANARDHSKYSQFKNEEEDLATRDNEEIEMQEDGSRADNGYESKSHAVTDDQKGQHMSLMLGEQSTRSKALPMRNSAFKGLLQVGHFSRNKVFFLGIIFAQLGMILFNWGLTYGLTALGKSAGSILPGAFQELPNEENTPLFSYSAGIALVFGFGWCLGFLATIAEPALNILGEKVSHLTGGAFSKNLLIYSVSFGVATGIVLGLVKIVFPVVELMYLILGGYTIAMTLTFFSSEDFVNVAWDSAGVTTGPVTVPFVLTLGLSLGEAVKASDGFGILTMASVGPIISVLACGLWIRFYAWFKSVIRRR